MGELNRNFWLLGYILLIFPFNNAFGQSKYWIFFKDRSIANTPNVSENAIENRKKMGLEVFQISDFGPKTSDLVKIKNIGIELKQISKWFNAASANLSDMQVKQLLELPFIKNVSLINSKSTIALHDLNKIEKVEEIKLIYALAQIKANVFVENSLNGDHISVGVIDAGFYNANSDMDLDHLFKNNKILGTRDFVNPKKKDFFGEKESDLEAHGTMVLKAICGKKENFYQGLATQSKFYLARTESSKRETRIEEDNWIAAIEWLDSLGVRLVNSSLGYTNGFTDPKENYFPENMNGKTTLIAKGAKMAVVEKGMIIIASAGNEGGNKKWKSLVSSPADVEEVISVGAVGRDGEKMDYSSIGPENETFLKPEIAVFSTNGTSLAAPIVTGLVASILQTNPSMSSLEIKKLLSISGNLFPFPNNYVGFGFPDCEKIFLLINDKIKPSKFQKIVKKGVYVLEGKVMTEVLIFHKIDEKIVKSQSFKNIGVHPIEIIKPEGIKQSTLVFNNEIIELVWEN